MQSKAKNVSDYIKEIPQERIEAIQKLRKLCLENLIGYEETIEYGMPCYKKNNIPEVAFASQKNYISLYIMKQDVMKKNKLLLKNLKTGKGCIRYAQHDQMDFHVIKQLLVDTVNYSGKVC